MTVQSGRHSAPLQRASTRAAVVAAVGLLLGACNGGAQDEGSDDHGGGEVDLAHIHGMGINPADDELYVGSHHGLFRVTGQADPEQIAGRTQDFMGFTVVGPDHFLGSGHPGPDDTDKPPHLGLIESTDAGETWESVSLSGEADFHAMEAEHDRVYGYDSQSGRVMVSKDKKTWDDRAELALADIAVSPEEPEEILATTEQGPARSTDGGRNFTPIDGAPTLYFIDWPSADRLVGVDPEGVVHTSDDGGESWTKRGQVQSSPQAITTHDDSEVYVATEEAIHRSTDNGKTFDVFQPLQ